MSISFSFRGRLTLPLLALFLSGAAAPCAHAGFIYFTLTNPARPGMQLTVAEQIVCVTLGDCGAGSATRILDYQYYAINTGAFAVDGFSVGVGNRANAIAGGVQFADTAGGPDGVFPAVALKNPGNGVPFLTNKFAGSKDPGQLAQGFETALPNPVGLNWGFEEFDNRPAGGGDPASYAVRWYTAVQPAVTNQYVGGCAGAIPAANAPNVAIADKNGALNTPVVCGGAIYYAIDRFDLYSARSPVPGTGAPDPFGAGFFGFDDIINNTPLEFDAPESTNIDVCTVCSVGPPTQQDIAANIPEPSAAGLTGIGFALMLAISRVWRRRYAAPSLTASRGE